MNGPPKEKPPLGGKGLRKQIERGYVAQPTLQTVWLHWQRQAATFMAEFWRTGDERHLRAFCAHIVGMRTHLVKLTP